MLQHVAMIFENFCRQQQRGGDAAVSASKTSKLVEALRLLETVFRLDLEAALASQYVHGSARSVTNVTCLRPVDRYFTVI